MSEPVPICEVFIDESSQNNHAYFVLGGVIVPLEDSQRIMERFVAARLPELPKGEMKWAKVSRSKLPAYKRFIDLFFDHEFDRQLEFHSLVVESAKQNHQRFNKGSSEIGFNKELFQLAMKFGRLYPYRFHIYPDQRTTTEKTEDLRLMLNRATNNRQPSRDWPYRRVQFRDSKTTTFLQLADIMSGALAFRLNGHHKAADASPSKCDLATHVLACARISDVTRDTTKSGKFTVWHRKLR